MLDPTPDSRTRPRPRDALSLALRWFGLALVAAPFALAVVGVVATRALRWMPGDLPFAVFLAPVVVGAIGALPFFLLAPWLIHLIRWLDRNLAGVVVLAVVLSIPAVLVAIAFDKSPSVVPAWIVAFSSIAIPRLVAKSLRPGAFSRPD